MKDNLSSEHVSIFVPLYPKNIEVSTGTYRSLYWLLIAVTVILDIIFRSLKIQYDSYPVNSTTIGQEMTDMKNILGSLILVGLFLHVSYLVLSLLYREKKVDLQSHGLSVLMIISATYLIFISAISIDLFIYSGERLLWLDIDGVEWSATMFVLTFSSAVFSYGQISNPDTEIDFNAFFLRIVVTMALIMLVLGLMIVVYRLAVLPFGGR